MTYRYMPIVFLNLSNHSLESVVSGADARRWPIRAGITLKSGYTRSFGLAIWLLCAATARERKQQSCLHHQQSGYRQVPALKSKTYDQVSHFYL
jgi:hypothetical protein